MGERIGEFLEPLAGWFRSLGIPEPITQWGHPVMMGTVIFVMGGYAIYMGWRGRLATDGEVAAKSLAMHAQLMPFVTLFLALGFTGGVLSLVMQQHPIMESPHFWTGCLVLLLLGINGAIAFTGFAGNKKEIFRNAHAILGSVVTVLLVVHVVLGLNLGLSL